MHVARGRATRRLAAPIVGLLLIVLAAAPASATVPAISLSYNVGPPKLP